MRASMGPGPGAAAVVGELGEQVTRVRSFWLEVENAGSAATAARRGESLGGGVGDSVRGEDMLAQSSPSQRWRRAH